MNLYKIRMVLKHNKFIYGVYENIRNKSEMKKRVILKENGFDIISNIEHVLNDTDFLYFITFGSLLGLIREGDLISHDIDIDYAIIMDNKFKWENLESLFLKNGFKKIRQFSFDGEIREQTYKIDGLTIDFFGCKNSSDKTCSLDFYRKHNYSYKDKSEMHVREDRYYKILSTKKKTFKNVTVTIPDNPEKYLESIYSSSWRVPIVDWDPSNAPNIYELDKLGTKDLFIE